MRVVVGGATGFIGTALVRALLQRGDQVTVLARNAASARRTFGSAVEVREWHPPALGEWGGAVIGADAVVNLAGVPVIEPTKPWTASQKALIRSSRVDSTHALVEAIRVADPRPRVFVSQSAIGYYGDGGSALLTESSLPGSDFMASVVIDWERAAQPVDEVGVRLVTLRTAVVLGNGGEVPLLTLPFKLFFGGNLGRAGQWFSWIHLDDEIGLILHAIDSESVSGPLNATAPHPVTMETFSHELGHALHRPCWFPLYPLLFRVALGQRSTALLTSQRVGPEKAVATGYEFKFADVDTALQSLF
jgi:uncharacterized protein (TIGR01777 family)